MEKQRTGRHRFQQSFLWSSKFKGLQDLLFADQPPGGDKVSDAAREWTSSATICLKKRLGGSDPGSPSCFLSSVPGRTPVCSWVGIRTENKCSPLKPCSSAAAGLAVAAACRAATRGHCSPGAQTRDIAAGLHPTSSLGNAPSTPGLCSSQQVSGQPLVPHKV